MKMGHEISNSRIKTNTWWAKDRTNQYRFFGPGRSRWRVGEANRKIVAAPEGVSDVGEMGLGERVGSRKNNGTKLSQ